MITAIGNSTGTIPSGSTSPQVMGQDDFLRLLMTQMSQQDPLNPMESQEFAAQLAQFSSLEQLSQINSNLDLSLQSDMMLSQSIANNMAVGLLGKEVLAVGNGFTGPRSSVRFRLDGAAAEVTVEIRNTRGEVVRTLSGNQLEAGIGALSWDGLDNNGEPVGEDEQFTISVSARSADGETVGSTPLRVFQVNGISYEDGVAWLLCGDETVAFADVLQVLQP